MRDFLTFLLGLGLWFLCGWIVVMHLTWKHPKATFGGSGTDYPPEVLFMIFGPVALVIDILFLMAAKPRIWRESLARKRLNTIEAKERQARELRSIEREVDKMLELPNSKR
jgi:hypothetical protein